jgi:hypothetical protein
MSIIAVIPARMGSSMFPGKPFPPESLLRSLENVCLVPYKANASLLTGESVHTNIVLNLLQAICAGTKR